MLLLVDVGNTQTVIGIASDADKALEYSATWRISTEDTQTADDIVAKLVPLFQMSGVAIEQIDQASLASVVPVLTVSWQHAIKKVWGIEALMCTYERAHESGLFETDYPNPHEIGSDRVADAVAARMLYGAPVVVVDFGTATNIEVIDASGKFIGGIIAPGITTGAQALFKQATQIATIGYAVPPSVIGKSTAEAVQSGILYGEVGRVDGLLEHIFKELGTTCPVVATGGLAHTVTSLSKSITDARSELTLDGLRMLAERKEKC